MSRRVRAIGWAALALVPRLALAQGGEGLHVYSLGDLQDVAWDILGLPDGDALVAAETSNEAGLRTQAWLLRERPNATLAWSVVLGEANVDRLTNLVIASDGALLAAGETGSFGAQATDGWIVKLDAATGGVAWQERLGGASQQTFFAASATSDGGAWLAGTDGSRSPTSSHGWVVRVGGDGAILAQRHVTVDERTTFLGVLALPGDGALAVGATRDASALGRPLVVELAADGGLVRAEERIVEGLDQVTDIAATPDGGAVLIGIGTPPGGASTATCVIRRESDGTFAWARWLDTSGSDQAHDVMTLADGRILLTLSIPGPAAAFIVLDAGGSLLSVAPHGELGNSITQVSPLDTGRIVAVMHDDAFTPADRFLNVGILRVADDGTLPAPCWTNSVTVTDSAGTILVDPVAPATSLSTWTVVATADTSHPPATTPLVAMPCNPVGLPPGEVLGVRARCAAGAVELTWDPLADADTYEAYRGTLSALQSGAPDHGGTSSCDLPGPRAVDLACGDALDVYWLVRGRNSAGVGPLGADSLGRPRADPSPACP